MAQAHQATSANRYPSLFSAVQQLTEMQGAKRRGGGLRILSFGCSDASEMHSLRAYFPEAVILGCDINLSNSRHWDALTAGKIFLSTPAEIAAHGPYDMIFALSVLCWSPVPLVDFEIRDHFPFSEFEDHCGTLASNLKHGGILAIYNASYPFHLTAPGRDFMPVRAPTLPANGEVAKWAPDGTRLSRREDVDGFCTHRLYASGIVSDELFRDCIFLKSTKPMKDLAAPRRPMGLLRKTSQRLVGPQRNADPLLTYHLEENLFKSVSFGSKPRYFLRREWIRKTPGKTMRYGSFWQPAFEDQLQLPATGAQLGLSFGFA